VNCGYAEARDQNAHAQPSIPLCVGRSTVAQKIRKILGTYLHVFQTYIHNMRGLSPFPAQKFPIFSNLDRGGGEWGLGRSIPTQVFQIIGHSNYVYQVKMELEKRDLQRFPEWGGTALSEFWEGEEERIGCRWVKSLLNLLLFKIYNTVYLLYMFPTGRGV